MQILFTALFVLVPLIWLPWTSELFEFNKLMLTYVIAILIGTTWAIKCILAKKIIFRRTILDIPLLIFLGSSILALLGSIDIHTSWYGYYSRWNGGLQSLISYSLLYWAYVSNMDSKATKSTIFYSLISATLISIYASFEHFGHSASCLLVTGSFDVSCWIQDVQNRVYATMGQPNWLAAYLVALIFVPLANFQFSKSNFQRIFNASIFILLFSTLLFTKSRSGLLAFGISSALFWGGLFFIHKSKFIIHTLIFSLCIFSFLIVIKNPIRDLIIKPTVTEKVVGSALEVGGTESGSIRKIVWKGAINIWLGNVKNFMIGAGPETFAQAYYQYRPTEHNNTSEWELLYNKAHNEFLNTLATTGIIGLISYLSLLIIIIRIFIKTIYDHRMTMNDNDMTIALFAGWLTISITNFWGFSVVVTQLLLFLLPAMAITLYDK
ncbi:O-antigen ligase family protein [Candidatus Amesbacteria bacterium]|nr:O-antigen ligase family protein [Candidatus Amesbacteria bacterium]